ncbi:hypothetical protein [Micromonospora sp. NPDC047074]|uniref:hypothetical protein n=1 Tax=Micromonospora sp. NPDC047074 TaxID=3154339 RepID=UPI0033F93B4B
MVRRSERVISVALVDEQEPTRHGLAGWLAADRSIAVVGSAPDVDTLLAGPGRDAAVVLLDAGQPDRPALPREILALTEAGRSVVVTAVRMSGRLARVALANGAAGLLSKTAPAGTTTQAIRAAAAGNLLIPVRLARELVAVAADVRLSPQETTATRLYTQGGLSLPSVARLMGLSPQTVKQYIDRARGKYRSAGRACPTKVHLYQRLVEDGLVEH